MSLTHFDSSGQANMVDVAGKSATLREAKAQAKIAVSKSVMSDILKENLPKGDLFATARIAGIQGAKKTSNLIPLCHPLSLSKVGLDFDLDQNRLQIKITCTVRCNGRTGVEMEALTGVSIAALTFYDMVKGLDKGTTIKEISLLSKSGGKSGDWLAPKEDLGL